MSDKIAEQVTEYGYRTPDGREHFNSFIPGGSERATDLQTADGQKRAQASYDAALRRMGVAGAPLEFIQRVRTVSYSTAIPLPAGNNLGEDDF